MKLILMEFQIIIIFVVSSRETSAARERGEEAKQNSHGEIENIEQRRETHCR